MEGTAVGDVPTGDASAPMSLAGGLEEPIDNDAAPLPPHAIISDEGASIKLRGGPEEFRDDDDGPPLPPQGTMAPDHDKTTASEKFSAIIVSGNAGRPVEGSAELQMTGSTQQFVRVEGSTASRQRDEIMTRTSEEVAASGATPTIDTDDAHNVGPGHEREQDNAVIVTNAYRVEPDEAYGEQRDELFLIGEPLLPWFRQPRTKCLLVAVVIIVAILAVSLGVTLSRDRTETVIVEKVLTVEASSSPSISIVPTIFPSGAPTSFPSFSSAPTPLPTTLLQGQRRHEKSDRDGNDMVFVKPKSGSMDLLVIFYYEMEPISVHQLDNYGIDNYEVSIDGNTTTIEFEGACGGYGAQVIFERSVCDTQCGGRPDNSFYWYKARDSRCDGDIEYEPGYDTSGSPCATSAFAILVSLIALLMI